MVEQAGSSKLVGRTSFASPLSEVHHWSAAAAVPAVRTSGAACRRRPSDLSASPVQPTPSPPPQELNAAVRAMCKSGRLPVLSFSEGQPTKLGYIPTHVVPHESAYPG